MLANIKNSRIDRTRKIHFDLALEDLDLQYEKQDGKCFYTGIKLTLPQNPQQFRFDTQSYNVSIDRIDSNKGYTKDNVQLVLKCVNFMKQSMSHEDFLEMCKLIVENHFKG